MWNAFSSGPSRRSPLTWPQAVRTAIRRDVVGADFPSAGGGNKALPPFAYPPRQQMATSCLSVVPPGRFGYGDPEGASRPTAACRARGAGRRPAAVLRRPVVTDRLPARARGPGDAAGRRAVRRPDEPVRAARPLRDPA